MNCKNCIHFEACSRWTDFPKQCGEPTCRHFVNVEDSPECDSCACELLDQRDKARAEAVKEFHLLFEDKVGYHWLSNNSWIGEVIDQIKAEMLGGDPDGRAKNVCKDDSDL